MRRPRPSAAGSARAPTDRRRRSGPPALRPLDDAGRAEYAAAAIESLHLEEGVGGVRADGRLEALLPHRPDLVQRIAILAGEQPPLAHVRRAVPARVDERSTAFLRTCGSRRLVGGMADPREAVRPVRVCAARAELPVEQYAAVAGELGEVLVRSPADEHVPVRQELCVALTGRQQRLRLVLVAADEPCRVVLLVD